MTAPGRPRGVFRASLQLLLRNPSIVVPGVGAAAVAALAETLLAPARPLDSNLVSRLAQSLVQLVASILSVAYTTGMADAAWREGYTGFADGARAFRRNAGHVVGAMLVLFAIGAVAALLAPFTLGLSLLAYLFFCIYTPAAAVAGERTGIAAVGESVDIAFTRALPTLIVSLGIASVCFVTGALAELVATTPLVGPLAGGIVVQAAIAYAMIVVVGEYRGLGGTPI